MSSFIVHLKLEHMSARIFIDRWLLAFLLTSPPLGRQASQFQVPCRETMFNDLCLNRFYLAHLTKQGRVLEGTFSKYCKN